MASESASESALRQLRAIRDKIRHIDAERRDLIDGRNRLIRKAAKQGKTEGQIAKAAGLSPGRVNQVRHSR